MIGAIIDFARMLQAMLGQFALADPALSGSLIAVVVMGLAVAVLVVCVIAATTHAHERGSVFHPTRRTELLAPLAQSDPDAAGHIRRRGPGRLIAAA